MFLFRMWRLHSWHQLTDSVNVQEEIGPDLRSWLSCHARLFKADIRAPHCIELCIQHKSACANSENPQSPNTTRGEPSVEGGSLWQHLSSTSAVLTSSPGAFTAINTLIHVTFGWLIRLHYVNLGWKMTYDSPEPGMLTGQFKQKRSLQEESVRCFKEAQLWKHRGLTWPRWLRIWESAQTIKADLPQVAHEVHPLLGLFTELGPNMKVLRGW